ncbi:ATP-binding cassette subfamily B protein [Sedimentibacter acidaminivorans]|uniref:ATP-binding cassette subfamily B protein n=1 Tax=Sedimentibacter acidaminivorans TaxID=913099 RepID=A0ABS4GF49_9FIRM|nr:ABC transporter ATP-binding protein [Sedimentibacter acidaminivorans]MBP1926157.1 ATP-binding cassette subfamily B protein [Sedimentibacter acidaminivorans]
MLKIFKKLKKFSVMIAGVLIFVLLQTLCDLNIPSLMADIVNNGILKNNVPYVISAGIKMLIFTIGIVVFSVLSNLLSSVVSAKFSEKLRNEIFEKVENFSLDEFNKFGTASLITRSTNDVTQIQMVVLVILRMMVMAPIMTLGGIFMAIKTDAGLSWVLMIALPAIVVLVLIVLKFGGKLFASMQVKLDKVNLVMRENLTGIRVIRAFDRIDYEKARFKTANDDLTETAIKANKIMAILMPGILIILNFTTIAIVWFGAKRINIGEMQIGSLMAYIQYASLILFSFVMMSMLFVMVPRAAASAKRINEVLETETTIKEPLDLKYSNDELKGEVEFRNVSFSYSGADEPVLKNISFKASKGEVTAIIGGTGSGKSTLINLIPRFYNVTEGEILVDNVNIKDMSQHYLRNKIGIVPQKAVLFSGTIRDNIKYGKEDATDDEISNALDIAEATEFVSEMESGVDTFIAQGGKNVSGGQKQRLSIARALVRKPEIYIFDDSFSALDSKTDAKVRKSLLSVTKNSAVIIVAQKISSIINADRIIVLDEGVISGIGTHNELMKNNDVYREMASSQLREE